MTPKTIKEQLDFVAFNKEAKIEGVKYSQIIETNQENIRLQAKLRIAEEEISQLQQDLAKARMSGK